MCAVCDGLYFVLFFKQKTAYDVRISDWSSDVCSSDLNVIDPSIGFARPRFKDGSWWKEYDPIQIGHDVPKWRDYTEANGWQATFLNQHDLYGLKIGRASCRERVCQYV